MREAAGSGSGSRTRLLQSLQASSMGSRHDLTRGWTACSELTVTLVESEDSRRLNHQYTATYCRCRWFHQAANLDSGIGDEKNHLSTLSSIGAGSKFSPFGMFLSWLGSTRSGELEFVTLALFRMSASNVHESGETTRYFLLALVVHLQVDVTRLLLSGDQPLPSITALPDDLQRILAVFALATESKLILWLSIWDLVGAEPFVLRSQQAWQMSLGVFNIIEFGSRGH
jgi:hypothetical protein